MTTTLSTKPSLMHHNPELTRNLWLEFSPARLAGMPLVLAGIFYLAYLNNRSAPWEAIADAASNIFIILVFLWGGYRAASAVVEEVSANTWDFQRLSSLSPWTMTIGKLFGSTSYCWYGAALALALYAPARLMQNIPPSAVMKDVLLLLGTGLLCQTVALLMSMHNMHKRDDTARRHLILYLITGLIAAGGFYRLATSAAALDWYGYPTSQGDFFTASLFLFLAWALGGLYRTFRHELQYRCGPGFWGAFMAFTMMYAAGFTASRFGGGDYANVIQALSYFWPPFLVGGLFVYLSLYFDDRNLVRYRQLADRLKAKDWAGAYLHTPRWLVALVLFAGVCLLITISLPWSIPLPLGTYKATPAGFVLASLLFAARDIAIVHYFAFGPKAYRADFSSGIFLAIMYLLLPALLTAGGQPHALSWFLPGIIDGFLPAVLPPLLQCGLAAWLLRRRLTKAG